MLIPSLNMQGGSASLDLIPELPPLEDIYLDDYDPMMSAEEGYVPFQDDLIDDEYEPDVVDTTVPIEDIPFDDDFYDDDFDAAPLN